MARLTRRIRSVQSPIQLVMKLIGLAVRFPIQARYPSTASGARQAPQSAIFSTTRPRRVIPAAPRAPAGLVRFLQVHPRVETRHLVVAIEHQRLAPAELADAALGGLAPARVVHLRV